MASLNAKPTSLSGTTEIDIPKPSATPDAKAQICHAENICYVMINADRRITYVSDNLHTQMTINDDCSFEGRLLDDCLDDLQIKALESSPDPQSGSFLKHVKAGLEASAPYRDVFSTAIKSGEHFQISCSYSGRGTMLASFRDVSEHHHYRNLFEISMKAANAGFWSVDLKTGKFTYSESVLARLSEKEVQQTTEMGLWSIIHPADLPEISKEWMSVMSTQNSFDFTYRVQTENDGVMWQRSIGEVIRAPNGHPLSATAFVMDITEDVENRAELKSAQETSKAKSEFLARMSHEIRTPLNAIIGMADSLSDEPLTDDVRDVVKDIEDAAEGLHHLLSRTLDHAKLVSQSVSIDLEEQSIRDIIDVSQRLWRPQIRNKNIDFKVFVDPSVPQNLMLDEFRLGQCLNNLLSNATKFTTQGTISLIVKSLKHKGRDHTIIAVKDSGMGMEAAEVKHIFTPFTQADGSITRRFGGTGLGMSITHQLVDLMGGEIKVRSVKGEGSTFAMLLPVVTSSQDLDAFKDGAPSEDVNPAAAKTPPEPAHMPVTKIKTTLDPKDTRPFEGLNVLCVEDNAVNQKVVKRLIGKRVKALHFADHGVDALKILNTTHIDVVLMDIHMPVMDGIETTIEIRKSEMAYANVIIIALTADPDYQQKRICRNIGMDDTIAKPVRREDILGAFDRAMSKVNSNFGQKVAITG